MLAVMDGVLLIDKPKDWTSFDVVHKVRQIVEQAGLNTTGKKRFPVGHTGTLDPLATGLLIVLLGSYTKCAGELSKLDKTYEVTMRLGETSTTGDEEGEKTKVSDKMPPPEAIEAVLRKFTGSISQVPPKFSAVKVGGQRAYKLARAGKTVEMKPRTVTVYGVHLTRYQYPLVKFTARVSSGTYIRSLVEDIGIALGVGAYTQELRRILVGNFSVKDAMHIDRMSLDEMEREIIKFD